MALTTEVEDPDFENPEETIFHEYVHMLFHSRDITLPTWLNEGIAELYSTFRIEKNMVEIGAPKELYVYALNNSALLSLPELFAVNESSPDYNEEHRAGMFYAQSWALAHYLLCGADRTNAKKLMAFVDSYGTNLDSTEANFKRAFGITHKEMLQQLREYLEGGRYLLRRTKPELGDIGAGIKFTTPTEAERDRALINLRWRVHRSEDTAYKLIQLAQKAPDSPRIPELQATLSLVDMKLDDATRYWQRAIDLKSDNAFTHYALAESLLREAGITYDFDERLSADQIEKLRALLDRALVLSPDYVDAMQTLVLVEARAPEMRIAVLNRIQAAVETMKDRAPTLLGLAMVRGRMNDWSTCEQILDMIIDSKRAEPAIKNAAKLLKTQVEERKAEPSKK